MREVGTAAFYNGSMGHSYKGIVVDYGRWNAAVIPPKTRFGKGIKMEGKGNLPLLIPGCNAYLYLILALGSLGSLFPLTGAMHEYGIAIFHSRNANMIFGDVQGVGALDFPSIFPAIQLLRLQVQVIPQSIIATA